MRKLQRAAALAAAIACGAGRAEAASPASAAPMFNPQSTLALTSATSAYAAGQLVASSATAAGVVVPSVQLPQGHLAPRLRLWSNDATSTAWGGVGLQVDLWSSAPTFVNGDRAAWSISTGSAAHLAAYSCTFSAVAGDGVYAECAPTVGSAPAIALTSSTVYWTLQTTTASGVTGASKSMTLTVEAVQ